MHTHGHYVDILPIDFIRPRKKLCNSLFLLPIRNRQRT